MRFSRRGGEIRYFQRGPDANTAQPDIKGLTMHGKTVVITGATSGIGQVAAETLARQGARIVFVARDAAKGQAMQDRLVRANPDAAHDWVRADLSTIAAMKAAGEALAAKAPHIDVLINNAGAIFDHREVTADGLEKTFAVNHMAYFVVTETLRPALADGARIVSTASTAHTFARLDFDDLQSATRYAAFRAYGLSKLCNILWTRELARRLEGSTVTANCLHPGGVNTAFGDNTKGLMSALFGLGKRFMLTPEQGADTLTYLAASPDVAGRTGGYWAKRAPIQPSATARDPEFARRLWDISARLAGVSV
jgi:NAD(P)-dependent dehydrogenase (short-subunit alcohol dehydrogenase family)